MKTLRMVVVCLSLATGTGVAAAQCPGANPNDGSPDSAALQACLDAPGVTQVYLDRGNPGYIIDVKLRFRSDDKVLASSGPDKAILIAGSSLDGPMLETQDAYGYTMFELIFDGRKSARSIGSRCDVPGSNRGSNLVLSGDNWVVHHIDTVNALCGSAMAVTGGNYQVYSVYASDNGSEDSGRWADGITLNRCDGGYVHHNTANENTDVGIVVGRGYGCVVRFNTVQNFSRHAFAGIHVGGEADSHAGSEVKDNTISSGYDRLAFGLMVGSHPWGFVVSDVGTVSYNSISGAVVNLAVDGVGTGTVSGNTVWGAQGSYGYSCSLSANYTIGDYGGASLQGGWDYTWHYNGPIGGGGCGAI